MKNSFGVGYVTPGFEITDNPYTGSRSLGYGCDCAKKVSFSADSPTYIQQGPATLATMPTGGSGRVVPSFENGPDSRALGYGADLPSWVTANYPSFLQGQHNLPFLGAVTLGTIIIGAVVAFFVVKKIKAKKEEMFESRRYMEKPGGHGKSMYVKRNKEGEYTEWNNINRSIRADMRQDAEHHAKPGHGHEGDVSTPEAKFESQRYREAPGGHGKEMYVKRGKGGQFKEWNNINRSIRADMRQDAENTAKPGHGHEGDLE